MRCRRAKARWIEQSLLDVKARRQSRTLISIGPSRTGIRGAADPPIRAILATSPYLDDRRFLINRFEHLWPIPPLLADLNRRSIWGDPPELFDFFVGHRDTTCRPIFPTMEGTDPAAAVGKAVNHDIKSAADSARGCASGIFLRWIRNMEREMKIALGIPAIDLVNAFRRLHIAFFFFCSDRTASQGDAIGFDYFSLAKERQFPRRFFNEDLINRRVCRQMMPDWVRVKKDPDSADRRDDHD